MSHSAFREDPIDLSAGQLHTPAANTAAVITLAAPGAGKRHRVSMIVWSYNAAPTGGNLKIEEPSGTTVFSTDIVAAGPGSLTYTMRGNANTELVVTLAAGGAAVTGKLTVFSRII